MGDCIKQSKQTVSSLWDIILEIGITLQSIVSAIVLLGVW